MRVLFWWIPDFAGNREFSVGCVWDCPKIKESNHMILCCANASSVEDGEHRGNFLGDYFDE